MFARRLQGRRQDGAAAVRGWTALYTLGLQRSIQDRRRREVAADLAEESLDAMRRGAQAELFRQRMVRLVLGIPADITWRLVEAPQIARSVKTTARWVPLSRWSGMLMSIVAIGSSGAFAIVTVPYLTGRAGAETWQGWGPVGASIGAVAAMVGIVAAVPWPRRGAAIMIPGVAVGLLAAPWLWGCWFLCLIGLGVRLYETADTPPPSLTPVIRGRRR